MAEHPDLTRLHAAAPSRAADAVAHVLDPILLVLVTLLVVAVRTSTDALAGFGWAAVALVFCAVLPELALRLFMRARGLTDRHLVVREHRHAPVLASVVSTLVGVLVLWAAGAPAATTAFVLTVLAGVAAMALLTRWWKASFHTAVATSMTVVLVTLFGPAALAVGVPVVVVVGWARVRAGRHSAAQVLVGGVVGALSAAVFPLLA